MQETIRQRTEGPKATMYSPGDKARRMDSPTTRMLVTYQPNPIPWRIQLEHGQQTRPGIAHITLTVRAINADTFDPVSGTVTSVDVPPEVAHLVDNPNHLNFPTNQAQALTLSQMTSREVSEQPSTSLPAPSVRISATGFQDAFLLLE